jgi:hypothetical protein
MLLVLVISISFHSVFTVLIVHIAYNVTHKVEAISAVEYTRRNIATK